MKISCKNVMHLVEQLVGKFVLEFLFYFYDTQISIHI